MATLMGVTVLLTGCSSSNHRAVEQDPDNLGHPVPAGDPTYALTALHDAPEGDYGVLPMTLAEALPNHRLTLQGKTDDHVVTFSRALVVGRVFE